MGCGGEGRSSCGYPPLQKPAGAPVRQAGGFRPWGFGRFRAPPGGRRTPPPIRPPRERKSVSIGGVRDRLGGKRIARKDPCNGRTPSWASGSQIYACLLPAGGRRARRATGREKRSRGLRSRSRLATGRRVLARNGLPARSVANAPWCASLPSNEAAPELHAALGWLDGVGPSQRCATPAAFSGCRRAAADHQGGGQPLLHYVDVPIAGTVPAVYRDGSSC